MKYKVGDRVRIKSLDWYNENKSKSHGTVACGSKYFDYDMRKWCGKIMTILTAYQTCYIMQEDRAKDLWTDEMIEGLVEEPLYKATVNKNGNMTGEFVRLKEVKQEINLPDGYIFKDENGNVINTTKIVLEKKKKEYPKTYEECCDVLSIPSYYKLRCYTSIHDYNEYATSNQLCSLQDKLNILGKLLICRDAYWKIAGEEMGLGKPWEPDWKNQDKKYIISVFEDTVIYFENETYNHNTILAFPTAEMRDTFKENFDPDIEICKELL